MKQLSEIISIVRALVGSGYLYFDTPILVKKTPHTIPVNAWAVCASPSGKLYIMDAGEQWHELNESDALVIPSLYQRLKAIESKYFKTA